jgi:hypothetical protein
LQQLMQKNIIHWQKILTAKLIRCCRGKVFSLYHIVYYWLTDRLFILRLLGIPLGVNRCQISKVDRCILHIHRILCIVVIQ